MCVWVYIIHPRIPRKRWISRCFFSVFLLSSRPVFCLKKKQWTSFKINTFLKICNCCEMGWFHFWACKIQVISLARMGHWWSFCWWVSINLRRSRFSQAFTIIYMFLLVNFNAKKKHIFLSINCVLTYSYHRYYSVKHEVQRAWRVFDPMFLGN